MATVQLSDIIDVKVFRDLPAVNSPEKTAFFESGVIAASGLLNDLANQPGKIAELPFWKDLDGSSEVNYSSDDPSSTATPEKVVQGSQIGRKAFVNKGWSASDLATELAMGPRAMDHIRSRTDMYFTRQWQRRLIACMNGVKADNVANDSGDMVNDIAIEDGDNAVAANLFSRQAFTGAAFTSGDHFDDYNAMAVHSVVYKRMIDNDDIDFIPDSQGNLTIATFMGRRIIVDDGLPVEAGSTSGFKYTSVLFGAQAVGYGEGSPTVPVAVQREEDQGDGGGIETLWVRNTWLLHPFGFQNTGTPSGDSYTLAELAAAGAWDRVVERKNVPLSFLVTNG